MALADQIVTNPAVSGGKAVIRGTRLPVEFLLELLDAGEAEITILANYPGLTSEDLEACRRSQQG